MAAKAIGIPFHKVTSIPFPLPSPSPFPPLPLPSPLLPVLFFAFSPLSPLPRIVILTAKDFSHPAPETERWDGLLAVFTNQEVDG